MNILALNFGHDAAVAVLRDQEVVHYMLGLQRGQFSFQTKVEAGEMSMQGITLTGILLDFSRQQDEGE